MSLDGVDEHCTHQSQMLPLEDGLVVIAVDNKACTWIPSLQVGFCGPRVREHTLAMVGASHVTYVSRHGSDNRVIMPILDAGSLPGLLRRINFRPITEYRYPRGRPTCSESPPYHWFFYIFNYFFYYTIE